MTTFVKAIEALLAELRKAPPQVAMKEVDVLVILGRRHTEEGVVMAAYPLPADIVEIAVTLNCGIAASLALLETRTCEQLIKGGNNGKLH